MNTVFMTCYTATQRRVCGSPQHAVPLWCVFYTAMYFQFIRTSRPYMKKQSYCTRPQQTNIRGQTYFTKQWLEIVIDFWKFDYSLSNSCYRKTFGFINRVLIFSLSCLISFSFFLLSYFPLFFWLWSSHSFTVPSFLSPY
jgi:hypothetical protein